MAFDTYTESQVRLWAAWRARKVDGGHGFPKKCAFVTNPSGGFWTPEMDSPCYQMDDAVCALSGDYKEAFMQYYTESGTNEQKARACHCSIRTFWRRIEQAQLQITNTLSSDNRRRL